MCVEIQYNISSRVYIITIIIIYISAAWSTFFKYTCTIVCICGVCVCVFVCDVRARARSVVNKERSRDAEINKILLYEAAAAEGEAKTTGNIV